MGPAVHMLASMLQKGTFKENSFYCSISYRTFFFSGLLAFKELVSIPWFLLVVNSTDAQFLLMH